MAYKYNTEKKNFKISSKQINTTTVQNIKPKSGVTKSKGFIFYFFNNIVCNQALQTI